MSLYLIKYDDNYADEFDISGQVVLGEDEHQEFMNAIENFQCCSFYFGTNEEMEYEDKESVEGAFTWIAISNSDYEVLNRLGLDDVGFASSFVKNVVRSSK